METIEALSGECLACKRCELYKTRTNQVFGVGDQNAEVMLIGEGPGEQEDLKGEPFVGRAGKLLDDMLAIIGLDRRIVYIANIVKCRPPKNRDPLPIEQETCFSWLDRQIKLIHPKIIICLGRIAAMTLIRKDFKVTQEHGKWFRYQDADITALYHPAALLRDPHRRPETFVDLKAIHERIKETCNRTSSYTKQDSTITDR
ncbi:MAG: uracil-DNA glycosylase [Clostridiales bacterium]|jgi:DNA polymerase|nr:uracil-DNA glycosylase [Clostridiales bacterium]